MTMRHKGLVVAVIVILALVAIATWIGRYQDRSGSGDMVTDEQVPAPRITREPLAQAMDVPEPGSKTEQNVAVPAFTGPAGPNTSARFRSFTVIAMNGTFSPNTVIARQGDTVSMNIKAVDGDYDFVQPDYGFNMQIAKGETKIVEFNASASGAYTFYCARCNNTHAEGSIIVNAQ